MWLRICIDKNKEEPLYQSAIPPNIGGNDGGFYVCFVQEIIHTVFVHLINS